MKKRSIFIFTVVPLLIGFLLANFNNAGKSQNPIFNTQNISPTDSITISVKGDIYQLSKGNALKIISNQNLIEPVVVGKNIAAISKTENYSSLILFDKTGAKIKTMFDGTSSNIDSMRWITDPNVNSFGNRIAYVSDKDREQTNVPDNALYVLNLTDGKSTNIANPDPYSGGLAHPVFNPLNPSVLLYDYYQYDPQSLVPYSTIEQFDKRAGTTTTLTFENLNAYQESFSPDGKQLLFLGRNSDSNNVSLYLADLNESGLSNIQKLLSGDLAYPVFSNTKNLIYFLKAQSNKGYDLIAGTVEKSKLTKQLQVVSGYQLNAQSSFEVTLLNN